MQSAAPVDELIERFFLWLRETHDSIHRGEGGQAPAAAPAPPVDLFTLFGEVRGLREDVKRDLKRSADLMAELRSDLRRPSPETPASDDIRGALETLLHGLDALGGQLALHMNTAAVELPEALLEPVFDLYDRTARNIGVLEETLARKGLLLRILGLHGELSGYGEAQAILLKKLSAQLKRMGIEIAGRKGEPFDPSAMFAVDVKEAPGAQAGTVLEVIRHGFIGSSRALRIADVIVSKRQ